MRAASSLLEMQCGAGHRFDDAEQVGNLQGHKHLEHPSNRSGVEVSGIPGAAFVVTCGKDWRKAARSFGGFLLQVDTVGKGSANVFEERVQLRPGLVLLFREQAFGGEKL